MTAVLTAVTVSASSPVLEYFFLDGQNSPQGPYPLDAMVEFLASQTIDELTLACRLGESEWRSLGDFKEIVLALRKRQANDFQQAETLKISDRDSFVGCIGGGILLILLMFLVQKGYNSVSNYYNQLSIPKVNVAESEFGNRWPLTVSRGVITRIDREHGLQAVIFISPDGQKYGLNGTAQTMGYTDIHQITKKSKSPDGTFDMYHDVFDLIKVGLDGKPPNR